MNAGKATPFDPSGAESFLPLTVRETAGLTRRRGVVDFAFTVPAAPAGPDGRCLRIVRPGAGGLHEVPAQFYELQDRDGSLTGRAVLFLDIAAGGSEEIRLYFAPPRADRPDHASGLRVERGALGPQHYWIENEFYKIETMPRSGQIWHVWNKRGSNTSWHHNEWIENTERGGDPCHWAPNCWVAYPERITCGYEMTEGRDVDFFDWHYVFGWEDPQWTAVAGPLFFELRRWGTVWPHPEHSNPAIRRDRVERIRAEVVYRFYDGLPWFYQSSRIETLEDLNVFFIRNGQFVFLDRAFTHSIIAPQRGDILPGDEVVPAVLHLLGKEDLKPFPRIQHSLSNVLPSSLQYLGFFNASNGDGFAQFHMLERNTNVFTGTPTYCNHATLFTELHDWSLYFCRAFSYTNQRFNPENATFLPRGERYDEENVCLIYRHENIPDTLRLLGAQDRELRSPLVVEGPAVTAAR